MGTADRLDYVEFLVFFFFREVWKTLGLWAWEVTEDYKQDLIIRLPSKSLKDNRAESTGLWRPSKRILGETKITRLETIFILFWQTIWLLSALVLGIFLIPNGRFLS